jgi:hypothetical protein
MFKIYALKNCGFCQKAVEELRLRGLPFLYCPLDGPPAGPAIIVTLEMIKKKYDWPTVPIIVKVSNEDEEFIGGYSDLVEYLDDEEPIM